MVTLRTTDILKLRPIPGLTGEPLGYLAADTLVYAVGGFAEADGLPWLNVAGPCQDGTWYAGWCAGGQDGNVYLAGYEIPIRVGYPLGSTSSPTAIPITQMFGENPGIYSRFGLKGHNGLDFGSPVGVPVLSVDAGVIAHARNDPSGYGLYVRVDHAWGISLYAHLSLLSVVEGQPVQQGTVIGMSGNTGMSSGPHLHIDIRIFPIVEDNGFGGRIDPLPFLPADKLLIPDYVPEKLRKALGMAQSA